MIEFSCNRSSGSLLCYFKLKGSPKVALIDGSGLQIVEDDRLIWPVIFILLIINKILLKFFRMCIFIRRVLVLQHWSSISYTEKDEKLKRDIDPITTGWMSRHRKFCSGSSATALRHGKMDASYLNLREVDL